MTANKPSGLVISGKINGQVVITSCGIDINTSKAELTASLTTKQYDNGQKDLNSASWSATTNMLDIWKLTNYAGSPWLE